MPEFELQLPTCPTENAGKERKGHQEELRRATKGNAGEPPEPRAAKSTTHLTHLGPFPSSSSPGDNQSSLDFS